MKISLIIIIAIIVAIATIYIVGPIEPRAKNYIMNANNTEINNYNINTIEQFIRQNEKEIENIRKGAQKEIIWNNDKRGEKTPVSIAYIHGFSASKREIRPLPDLIAGSIGANLFYTRLAGHGRNDEDMKYADTLKWLKDTEEAISVAEKIGEKVIVMGTSTGGALATIAAGQMGDKIDGIVLFSPNYEVKMEGAQFLPIVLRLPFSRKIVEWVLGKEFNTKIKNREHGKWWNIKYPTYTILPMQAIVEKARKIKFENVNVPALFIFHNEDGIVNPQETHKINKRWGAQTKVINEVESNHDHKHIIAGDVFAPQNTEILHQQIVQWIRSL